MTIQKPRLWKYKSGKKAGQLRPRAKAYLSQKLKAYYKRQKVIKAQFEEEQQPEEEKIKHKYKRESSVLTAYYHEQPFFDWRVSIINS